MAYYAIATNQKCKHCKQRHGFLTWKHMIIIARNEFEKSLMIPLVEKRPLQFEIAEVDFSKFNLKTVSVEEFIALAGK